MSKIRIFARSLLWPFILTLLAGAPLYAAGTVALMANDSLAATGAWSHIPYCFTDDALYATGTGAANGANNFQVGLADPTDTVDMGITNVVLYVKGYSAGSKAKIQLRPIFDGVNGTLSANIGFGRTEVTRSFNITSQRVPWHWSDVVNLSVLFRPRTATTFSVNAIFAVVTCVDTAVVMQRHYFAFNTIASPETLGLQFPVVIKALTTPGDTVMSAYNGTAGLADLTGTVTPNIVTFAAGRCSSQVTINQDTTMTVIAVNDGDTTNAGNAFAVINPGLHHFGFDTIFGVNNSQPQTITISALDFYGDTVSSWAGRVALWDVTATLTPDSSGDFIAGVWTGQVSFAGLTPPGGDTVFCSYVQGGHTYDGKSNAFDIGDGVAGTPGPFRPPSALAFRISPNPVRQDLSLDIASPHAGPLCVTMFNILGQVIMARELGAVPAGTTHVSLAVPQGTMPGVYLVSVAVGQRQQRVQKVILIR